MTREKWEAEKLLEAEGLDRLSRLFQKFDELLEEMVTEYGPYLDDNLVTCLECVRYDLNITLSGSVRFDKHLVVPGILKQLEDTMDEVQTLQAGLQTKRGVKDEDLQEDDE